MDEFERHDPPLEATEFEMLGAFLDYHRATLIWKVEGVSDRAGGLASLKSSLPDTDFAPNMTLFGLVKHLAYVERWWFVAVLAGDSAVSFPWTDPDPDADWRVEPGDTTQSIIAFYKSEVSKAREVIRQRVVETGSEAAALASHAKLPGKTAHTLRWIMVHMIEETARHNGHADFLREAIDGATGE